MVDKDVASVRSEAAEGNALLDGKQQDGRLKKEVGLLDGVAIILGIIIGSGIFISPKGVLMETGSVGMSLVVWSVCGLLSMIGALCYAELGTSIPKSGCDYAYIGEAFGPLPSFLYLWAANIIFVPTTNAIMALTVAKYVVQPIFPDCVLPDISVRLVAAACITGLTWLNCYSMKITTKLQNVFMFSKLMALGVIICVGFYNLFNGGYHKFENAFEGTSTNPSQISLAFYSGIYSYAGWNYLNFMTEELKDPFRNLPRAIYISIPVVTLFYVLTNIAYLAVLSPIEIIASDAIAVSFGAKFFAALAPVMSVLVACTALGSLSCHIMTSSRLCFVGARQGHFPTALSLISMDTCTPKPALVFLGSLSCVYLCTSDIYILINYSSFVETFFILFSITSLIYLRWKRPEMERPIKIHIAIPIVFLVICSFLLFLPLYVEPYTVGMAILITATGVPVYFIGIWWTSKPMWFNNAIDKLTFQSQKLFLGVKED